LSALEETHQRETFAPKDPVTEPSGQATENLRSERGSDEQREERDIADLENERARREQEVRALESRLLTECEQRDRTIRELDAEARALAGELQSVRAQMPGLLSGAHRRTADAAHRVPAVHRSRIWRAASALRTTPAILAMAGRSGDASARAVWRFLTSPRKVNGACIVARSGVFDESYYLAQNPDVASSRVHPLIHYVLWGALEVVAPTRCSIPRTTWSSTPTSQDPGAIP